MSAPYSLRLFFLNPFLIAIFFFFFSFLQATPAYAVGLGQSCTNSDNCDGSYICTNGTCQVDPQLDTSSGTVNNGGSASTVNNGGTGTVNNGGNSSTGVTVLQNPLNNINDLPTLLKTILAAVVTIGGIILSVMLVYVGFLFVVAQGNEEKIRSARSALMWTLIGGLILLGATAISAVVQSTASTL